MRFLQQSSIFQPNGLQDRTMISAKSKQTVFRIPQQPEPTTPHSESRNDEEEILIEEYDDWLFLEPTSTLFNGSSLIYNRPMDVFEH